ncbi:MAG: hypothetical protein KAU22_01915 [Desulfuromonadales bacterium]|nr:hypothetical protein [Desulfuromonadales bacterium]
MEPAIYTIRKNFLIPLGLVVILCFILLVTVLILQLPPAKIIILATFLLPATIIFAESFRRKVHIGTDAIKVNKLFRNKQISYSELTEVDTIKVRKRVFISLSSENDFIILSNSYDRFDQLIKQLVDKVPAAIVSEETRQLAEDPPRKCSDIFSAWLAVAVLVLIICAQLRGAF